MLRTLTTGQASSHADLATAAAMDRPYVTALVKRLTNRNLVNTVTDPVDRRRSLVTITEQGQRIFAVLSRQTEQLNALATTGIETEDLATFLSVLSQLAANLESQSVVPANPIRRLPPR